MKTIQTDVAILGGGMAGFSAAIAVARAGLKPLIVERRTSLGGMATTGMVMPFLGVYGDGKKIIAGNLDVILDAVKTNFTRSIREHYFDPEAMRHTLDILAEEYGIELLLDTMVADVNVRNRRIDTVSAVNKSGMNTISARCFIDATGDADGAVRAGVPWRMGRDSDGKTQAYTLRFMLGNVDTQLVRQWMSAMEKGDGFASLFRQYADRYQVPIMDTGFQNFEVPGRPGTLVFNVPRVIGINGVDGGSLTEGYLRARKLIRVYTQILRENVPGCEDAVITNTAESLGVRESRRIVGAYVLTRDDVAEGRIFDDGICGNCWWIDIHNPEGKGVSEVVAPKGGHNDIPYRALYTRQLDNLWVAGRCISADHEALASARIMPTCIATGQAAGWAATMALRSNKAAQTVDTGALRQALVRDGALITGINL